MRSSPFESLDTGLIKGHSYAEAGQGARIDKIKVTAQDEKGQSWPVIEIPEEQWPQTNTLFFEVTVQELPRGQQMTITTTVSFTAADGSPVDRTVADRWPP